MQKTDHMKHALVLAASVLALSAYAQDASSVKSSIETVDQLIKKENAELLARSQPAAAPSLPGSVARARPGAPTVVVSSIYGTSGRLKADLSVNGVASDALAVGSKVGSCQVREIANKCVVLVASSRATPASMCPTSCWTGKVPMQQATMDLPGMRLSDLPVGGRPMPAPLPKGLVVR